MKKQIITISFFFTEICKKIYKSLDEFSFSHKKNELVSYKNAAGPELKVYLVMIETKWNIGAVKPF